MSIIVTTACEIFVGLTSADAYKTLLGHIHPDRKVWLFVPGILLISMLLNKGKCAIFGYPWSSITL